MKYIVVDIKTNGSLIGVNSIISIGAIVLDKNLKLDNVFSDKLRPIGLEFDNKILKKSGFKKEETMNFLSPLIGMRNFIYWLEMLNDDDLILIHNNKNFSAAWLDWYFLTFIGRNPFKNKHIDINSLFKGVQGKMNSILQKDRSFNDPLKEAKRNAKELLYMRKNFNLKF